MSDEKNKDKAIDYLNTAERPERKVTTGWLTKRN